MHFRTLDELNTSLKNFVKNSSVDLLAPGQDNTAPCILEVKPKLWDDKKGKHHPLQNVTVVVGHCDCNLVGEIQLSYGAKKDFKAALSDRVDHYLYELRRQYDADESEFKNWWQRCANISKMGAGLIIYLINNYERSE